MPTQHRRNHRKLESTLALPILLTLLLFGVACSSTRTTSEQWDDATITSKIEAKLAADPEVSAAAVDVDTQDGIVRLSGTVKTAVARREAVDLAQRTSGVRGVINDIEIGERTLGDRIDDTWITSKINAKLTADPQINPFNIDVDTKDGVVTLRGKVATKVAKREAEQLARDTKGVVRVNNMVEVDHDHDHDHDREMHDSSMIEEVNYTLEVDDRATHC